MSEQLAKIARWIEHEDDPIVYEPLDSTSNPLLLETIGLHHAMQLYEQGFLTAAQVRAVRARVMSQRT